ncbi:MAG TPA: TonB-dependent receptor plug domain-containing protein [Chitinophagaceae bacterium]|jgi:outer membrane cobalamin receptor|nr:TonB-dependent receptor plug domain-containing protein [Chitinophagaceae bacterium]
MYLFIGGLRRPVLLLLCLSFYFLPRAQDRPSGLYLVQAASRMPVSGVLLQSEDASFAAASDDRGFVALQRLPASVRTLRLTRIGYAPQTLRLDSLGTGTPVVYLELNVTSLEEVQVASVLSSGVFRTISDLDIHLRPINNSQEVLRMVPGLFIGQHAGGGKAEQIFLRGFDIDHGTDINITVDGLPVNMVSHAHGQGYADLHFVIPELIERVQFDKGPYAADRGNFTTAGYVAFKTRDYLEQNFVKAEGGLFNTWRGIAGVNLLPARGERRSQSLYLAGEASYTNGYFESPQNFRRFNGILKYHGQVGPRHSLTASLTGFRSGWDASGQIPVRAVEAGTIGYFGAIDDTEGGHTSRYNASMALNSLAAGGAQWQHQLFYSRYAFRLYSNFTFFKEDPVNGDQIRQEEERSIVGYNGSYRRNGAWGALRTETTAGIQLRGDAVEDIELSRTRNRSEVTRRIMLGDIREGNAGAYWMQQLHFTPRFSLGAGLRADGFYNRYNDGLTGSDASATSFILSPKLHLRYRPSGRTELYLYNGRGFHSNDTRVAVPQNGRRVLPPAWGSDLGGVFKPGRKLILQTALWYLWLDQEFVYVGDEGVVEPGGQTRRYGVDLSARYELVRHLYADVDLSWAKPRALDVPKEEAYLPLAPRFTSVGGLTYRKSTGWNGSLRYRYMGDRPANEDRSTIAEGYFITDLAVNYTGRKWEAGLAVQNLFDRKWKETQFDTESRLRDEADPVTEIHFTPGTPFFARLSFTYSF